MKKIINFCKEKYKILIPIMVVLVLLITLYFLYREYQYDSYRNKKEEEVYQYYAGEKNSYTLITTYNLEDTIVSIEGKDTEVSYDSTPVYYKESNKVLFPKEMNIVFGLRNCSQYRLYKYATYIKEDNIRKINNGTNSSTYDYFFLYDGEGLYFLPYETELLIDNIKYITLSEGSYVSIDDGYTLIYYDKEKDESKVIDITNKFVNIKGENINIDLTNKYCIAFSTNVLLFSPNNLNPVFNN